MIRLAQWEDLDDYFEHNFCPLDKEVARLTGSKEVFTKEEITAYFSSCLKTDGYYFFLVIAPDGSIIGESVISEWDRELHSAHFRIALYRSAARGKGLGAWVTEATRDFAFKQLQLHRLSLDVYAFNPVAEAVYLKAGFKREGVLRDAIKDGDCFADIILMSLLEEEWRLLSS